MATKKIGLHYSRAKQPQDCREAKRMERDKPQAAPTADKDGGIAGEFEVVLCLLKL